ncbi:DUF2955 domain-containing protein [Cedecea neteri]|uniref:DUF2955 domain-containing protein n=1 Tax=Cedecea neteri TaxID=158822 RepID=UPI00155EE2A1|nr:DUF2955 domain-containing protein [Cedecea neteri]NIG77642.1 DUF2955 domain-containing protein [Klebsiella sp. Ap-873]WNJ81729.1 DUF2955 domain-containing protein [Cedecea neteri]
MFIKFILGPLKRNAPTPFSGNDFRHMLRIVMAGCVGMFVYSWVNTQYGVFYVVYPIMLTGLVPVFNGHIARQMIANALLNCVEMTLLFAVLANYPLPMTLIVFLMYMTRFYLMSRGPLFLFGSMGVVCLSVMANFLSYPTTDMSDLMFSNIIGSLLAVGLSALSCYLLPDVEPRKPPPPIQKDGPRVMHETLLASLTATILFTVFQVYTLNDSLAALMAGIFALFPMHFRGAILSSWWRIVGVIAGCLYAILVQLVIYDFSRHLILLMPLISLGLLLAARIHVFEKVGPGVGFSILTTLALMFGQYMHPNQDIVFSALYRISSVSVAIVGTLAVTFIIHKILNNFASTRYIVK